MNKIYNEIALEEICTKVLMKKDDLAALSKKRTLSTLRLMQAKSLVRSR